MAFFDFLTGADEAQDVTNRSAKLARKELREGRDNALNVLRPASNYAPIQGRLYDLTGINGAQAQQNAFGQYVESPEVQFQREQGEQAAQRSAAAGGRLASGRTLADLTKFGQGQAQQGYGDYYNRLRDLYGSALNTAGGMANIYQNTGSQLANVSTNMGAQAAQYAGQRGSVFGDLLSQGAALAAYAYGAKPGASGSSYGG